MSFVDWLLENVANVERQDKGEQNWREDLLDSIGSVFDIDNLVDKVDTRISEVDEKLEEADRKLDEVEELLEEVKINIGLLKLRVSTATTLVSLMGFIYFGNRGMVLLQYASVVIAIILILDSLLTIYRGLFGDFIVDIILRIKNSSFIERIQKKFKI